MKLLRLLTGLWIATAIASPKITVVVPAHPTERETLAAHEVRRYWYLRTGELAPIASAAAAGPRIEIGREPALGRETYRLASAGQTLRILGGDDTGALYGAYRFAERLGVRFYLHGDVVPDTRIPAVLPTLDETGKPLFAIRGIQPFHDFPEGPDWWNRDDYLAYVGQLPKLRMNFLGLHNYPEGGVGPEPGVWIGPPGDLAPTGQPLFSYPSQWANTARPKMWGYAAMKTSDFVAGASQLFETDTYGPEVMSGLMPSPEPGAPSNTLFTRTAALFQAAFTQARRLGVKTCIGTETPLTIPKLVAARHPGEAAQSLYQGMFRRIAALYPVDYYWLWTPEEWTWSGNKPEQLERTKGDIQAALAALDSLGKPFTIATSGWVLGPQNDRTALDALLPKDSPMSCINRQVGHAPDEPGFANLKGRPKWVIPWMENDPNLTAPQPWVGRMRYDAADARRLGCTGLLGIHWRTRILAPNVAALAAAAWDQSWTPEGFDKQPLIDIPAVLEGAGQEQNANPLKGRTMPVEEFYLDYARANFGSEAPGRILARIDGVNLPEPATWIEGPGGIKPDKTPWSEVSRRYAFVQELEALRPTIAGAGNLERFDYWLNTYRYMAAMAEAGCVRGQLNQAVEARDAARAIAHRTRLARLWERLITLQVAATTTPGELGTLANLEQHNRVFLHFLDAHDAWLAAQSGGSLPDATRLSMEYAGPPRLTVPTVRTLLSRGETLLVKAWAIDARPVSQVAVYWRPLGAGAYRRLAARPLGRAVYAASLPPAAADLEYYVECRTASGAKLVWPATAPGLAQTAVVR